MGDIARAVGCSQSTVSFVLNGNTSISISGDTRSRVVETARKLGYNLTQAKLLGPPATGAATLKRIGFMIDSLSTSPEGIVAIRGIQNALENTETVLTIYETRNHTRRESAIIEAMSHDGVEAVIYACIFTREVLVPKALIESSIPFVLLNCTSPSEDVPSVVPSEIAGGQRATQYLIDAGHQTIATIVGEDFMSAAQDRLKGYRRALATADIPFDPALVKSGDWSASAGYSGTKSLMESARPPTAIFCQNDRMAIGCYEYLKEHGYQIPNDVSVVGYDDEEISRHLSPMLTTINLPHREMGEWAVERLLGSDEGGLPVFEKLECELVERDSVSSPGLAR
ncbi:transcriptional regulator, LacI (ribose operon repressor) family [Rhodobacteraceae bacterium KLH11]|nr:transcriptional regulator, LacI (ribose operon repressor) family [Rhodobacteraceae bacterium KLH11]